MRNEVEQPYHIPELQWDELRQLIAEIADKVDEIHAAIPIIAENVQYLKELKTIALGLADLRDSLVGPATSKHQVETSFMLKVIGWICIMAGGAIAALSIFLLIHITEHGTRDVKLGPGGVSFTQPDSAPAKKNPSQNE